MLLERNKDEIIIRINNELSSDDLQSIIDFIKVKEIQSKYSTPQSVVDQFASEVNIKWYKENKSSMQNGYNS